MDSDEKHLNQRHRESFQEWLESVWEDIGKGTDFTIEEVLDQLLPINNNVDGNEDMNTDDNGDASGGIINRIVDFLNSFDILDDLLVQIEEIFGLAESRISPIILDLDEDGVLETTAELDSNDDGVINVENEVFSELQVWQDSNVNAMVDEG